MVLGDIRNDSQPQPATARLVGVDAIEAVENPLAQLPPQEAQAIGRNFWHCSFVVEWSS